MGIDFGFLNNRLTGTFEVFKKKNEDVYKRQTYYPLDDTDSNKYADGTAARLDGTEGDWMMYEPFFWSKGINDYLNGRCV